MYKPIEEVARVRAISYAEAEELCRNVMRQFVGLVPPYPAVTRALCDNPSASALEVATQLAPFWTKVLETKQRNRSRRVNNREFAAHFSSNATLPNAQRKATAIQPPQRLPAAPREAPRVQPRTAGREAPRPAAKAPSKPTSQHRPTSKRPAPTVVVDDHELETKPYTTAERFPKNPRRSENRVDQANLSTCPHGIPLVRRCRICNPDDWA